VSKLDPNGPLQCLDVAGGTGDIAIRILDHARTKWGERDLKVNILDINPEMLDEGRKRVAKTMYGGGESRFRFVEFESEELEMVAVVRTEVYGV
jgi:2-methoxy-6-polyprenyl-1,4-benzoquinol methylase